ncbi:MAG: pyruvate formate lyase family protein, partial [Chloroflexota bacterium]
CDSLGRLDQDLAPCYEADLGARRLIADEGAALVRQLWRNMDANSGWNVAIGGLDAAGESASNRLTVACLRAAQGLRRPNLALRLARSTPDAVWDATLDCIATGAGLPALYHEELYLRAIREAHLNVSPDDLPRYAFGGCTELMVHGCSNVGSLDGGLNLPLILAQSLDAALPQAATFEALWERFAQAVRDTVARLADQVSRAQAEHAAHQPQPLRTLLIDDCLEAATEFNAGGARYNWSVINVGGLGNVADALAAVRELVYERRELAADDLLAALRADYHGYEGLRARIARCPRYGNDDARADALARRVAQLVFTELRRYAPWRGGRLIPGCLMFVTYAPAGAHLRATPDGRRDGEPIADSIGAVAGRDRRGPTALFRSVASLPQALAPGTLVTNLRLAPQALEPANRPALKDLIRTYFELGGMQVQITVVDQALLREAVARPADYADLIVRVGGYSEYWRNLTPEIRASILERTEHTV